MKPFVIITAAIVIYSILKQLFKQLSKKLFLKQGKHYAKKLGLNLKEISHLNSIHIPWEDFSFIDFCAIEVLRLYVSTIRQYPELAKKRNLKRVVSV